MLIILDESISNSAEQLSAKELESLDDLLLCHSRLYHYVGAPKRVAANLIKKLGDQLNQRSLQTLTLISNQASDLQAIIRIAKFYAVARCNDLAGSIVQVQGEQTIWLCDIQYAAQWFSQPSTLIGEHLVDTKIFRVAATDMALESGLSHSMQRINPEMSGGCGNASEVLKNRIANALCPVLCVIDSDKLMPKVDLTAPIEKCHAVINEMKGVSAFFEIEQREIENLLPGVLLQGAISMLPRSPDRDMIQERYGIISNIRNSHPMIYRHIDIKEGTCCTWAKKKNVYDFFNKIGITGKCNCHKDCEGLIAPALFKEVLAKAVEFVESKNPLQLQKFLTGEERENWLGLGKIVMSFSLANSIRVT